MCCIKMLHTRQIHHFFNFTAKLAILYGFDKKVLICSMNLLIVAATDTEIGPLNEFFQHSNLPAHVSGGIIISGAGMTSTTYELTRHLQTNKYDLVLQAGVA